MSSPSGYPAPKKAWYSVILLTIAYAVSLLDRQVMNLMVGPIKADFALSDTEISLLMGLAFGLFYAFIGVPLGRATDRYNRRNIIVAGMTCWCLFTAACGLARDFWQLFAARIGVGVGEAALSPAALSIICDSFPKEKRTFPIGVYNSAIYIGGGIALIVGGIIISIAENSPPVVLPVVGELAAWQTTFIVVGIPGLVIAALIALTKEPERKEALVATTEEGTGESAQLSFRDVLAFLRSSKETYASIFAGMAVVSIVNYMFGGWLPVMFVRTYGWSVGDIGLAYGIILIICGPLGLFVGGRIGDWLNVRGDVAGYMQTALAGSILLAVGATFTTIAGSATLSLVLLTLIPFSLAFITVNIVTALMYVTPNQLRGQVYALMLLTMNMFGLVLGPTIVALITDFVFDDESMVGYSMSLVAFVSSIVCISAFCFGIKPFRKFAAETT